MDLQPTVLIVDDEKHTRDGLRRLLENDYDVYVHSASNGGPILAQSGNSAPQTFEENTFDVNATVTAGVNDKYTVHVVYFAVGPADAYRGDISLGRLDMSVYRVLKLKQTLGLLRPVKALPHC